jgi:hypothetical protein
VGQGFTRLGASHYGQIHQQRLSFTTPESERAAMQRDLRRAQQFQAQSVGRYDRPAHVDRLWGSP